ncbi:MAG TPA: hypothetical protein VNM37_19070, partial [Candidatus Dormibacteraeota bacterium]|nr:hypothetical protein [Candidatus Dormibacteraeota bacterium]
MLDSVHVGAVSDTAGSEGRRLRLYPLPPFIVARRFGFPLRFSGLDCFPGADRNPGQKRGHYGRRGAKHQFVPANRFLEPVRCRGRTGDHRLVVQMPLNIGGHIVGRFVT